MANGLTHVSGDLTQTIAHGEAATAPTVANTASHAFVEWDSAFDSITGNLTVTAVTTTDAPIKVITYKENLDGSYDKAVLICGTGAGMSVVANKYKGVYAVACEGVYSAKMARAINNANVLCMGGWIVGPEMAVEMVKTFLNTDWCQDLEDWRAVNMHKFAAKVDEIEASIYGA